MGGETQEGRRLTEVTTWERRGEVPGQDYHSGSADSWPRLLLEAHYTLQESSKEPLGGSLLGSRANLVYHSPFSGGTDLRGTWTPQMEDSRPPGRLIRPHEDLDTGQPRCPGILTFDFPHWGDALAFELKSKSHSCILALFKIHLTKFLVCARPCPTCYRSNSEQNN